MCLVYLRSHCRRPVRLTGLFGCRDAQAALPLSWCSRCGMEVFEPEEDICVRCKKEEEKWNDITVPVCSASG